MKKTSVERGFSGDHLSSTSLVMDSSGELLSENRYMPFGEVRNISGTTHISQTDFGYTGQRAQMVYRS